MTHLVQSAWSLKESYAYCHQLAKRARTNFFISFLALPKHQRRAMCVLYAFMRLCDDLGDAPGLSRDERVIQLDAWESSLTRALRDGQFDHAVFPALADIVAEYAIPSQYLFDVIDGVRMDLDFAGFATFEELATYCYHVAGAVGLCCIHIWGFSDDKAIPDAIDCGLAFQLTNILRDLSEDARLGRVYLPRDDLDRFGYSIQDIRARRQNESYRQLMAFETSRAETYYDKAESLFDVLDPVGKPILRTMLDVYHGLLREIRRREYDVYSRRVRLSQWNKLRIATRAVLRRLTVSSSR